MKKFDLYNRVVSSVVDVMLSLLIIIIIIVMGEAIYEIVTNVIPLQGQDGLEYLVKEIATLFILLEIILMLIRYIKDGHHIPVRYLILISITAVAREILLNHGGGLETLYLTASILVLVVVLFILQKVDMFHGKRPKE